MLRYTLIIYKVCNRGAKGRKKLYPKQNKKNMLQKWSPKILISNPSMYENQLYMLLKLCKRIVPRTTTISITNAMCMVGRQL